MFFKKQDFYFSQYKKLSIELRQAERQYKTCKDKELVLSSRMLKPLSREEKKGLQNAWREASKVTIKKAANVQNIKNQMSKVESQALCKSEEDFKKIRAFQIQNIKTKELAKELMVELY